MGADRGEDITSPEIRRIEAAYARREIGGRKDRLNAGRRLMEAERDRLLAEALRRDLAVPLAEAEILDVGCGEGHQLAWLQAAGARVERLHGVDLLLDRIARARSLHPNFDLVAANAERLPFPSRSFDLLVCMTVFSSILQASMARNVAREMTRILRPGGLILWYDIRYPNPWNPNVRAMTRGRVQALFPDFAAALDAATLVPQIARGLGRLNAPHLAGLYAGLARVPVLRSHLLGTLRAARSGGSAAAAPGAPGREAP